MQTSGYNEWACQIHIKIDIGIIHGRLQMLHNYLSKIWSLGKSYACYSCLAYIYKPTKIYMYIYFNGMKGTCRKVWKCMRNIFLNIIIDANLWYY